MTINCHASFSDTKTELDVFVAETDDVFFHISSPDGHSVAATVSADTARRLAKQLKQAAKEVAR